MTELQTAPGDGYAAIRILLVDDHLLVREGLRSLLEAVGFNVAGEARDGREALELAQMLQPEVAVMDIGMPGLNGVDACRELLRGVPGMRIIVLTEHSEDAYVVEALGAGARGYVLKTQAGSDLVRAIGEVTQGRIYLSPSVSGSVVKAFLEGATGPTDPLTPREREVLQLVAEGHTNREIAARLGISVHTVNAHRVSLMSKLDIHDAQGLTRFAMRHGLVAPES
jgi:DNA-binding NarL/FixJ family response regulator